MVTESRFNKKKPKSKGKRGNLANLTKGKAGKGFKKIAKKSTRKKK